MEQLLPEYFGNPDDSGPISAWGMPPMAALMRVGFERREGSPPVFEGETAAAVRLCERVWRYRQPSSERPEKAASRWRLELAVQVSDAGPLAPHHTAVIAQEPYESTWLQRATFKMYSKKGGDHRKLLEVPKLKEKDDPIEWLERNLTHDPWEKGESFVAGIGHPKGFRSDNPRNSAGDLIFGACPDFNSLVEEIWKTVEVRRLLDDSRSGRLAFWYRGKVDTPPRLHPEVMEECETLMGYSIEQALAGPRKSAEKWIGQPVTNLVKEIYCGHLNNRNRVVNRQQKRQTGGSDYIERWS
jgi:hypothetical protein